MFSSSPDARRWVPRIARRINACFKTGIARLNLPNLAGTHARDWEDLVMATSLCFSEANIQIKRLTETADFCIGKAARAENHTRRSYWLSNHMLNVQSREQATSNMIGWASRD